MHTFMDYVNMYAIMPYHIIIDIIILSVRFLSGIMAHGDQDRLIL